MNALWKTGNMFEINPLPYKTKRNKLSNP